MSKKKKKTHLHMHTRIHSRTTIGLYKINIIHRAHVNVPCGESVLTRISTSQIGQLKSIHSHRSIATRLLKARKGQKNNKKKKYVNPIIRYSVSSSQPFQFYTCLHTAILILLNCICILLQHIVQSIVEKW